MWKVDLHTHTVFSSDGMIQPEDLIKKARSLGLARIAVTDHNTVRGAFAAAAIDPELIIPGEEIRTTEGELLAYYLKEEIPRGLTPEDTIERLRSQGAVISVAHPYDRWRTGAWREESLLRILPLVDAIEGLNARCIFTEDNHLAVTCARTHGMPITAGSDGHEISELGRMGLEMPEFHDAESFRAALRASRPFGGLSPWWVHFYSSGAKWTKRIKRWGRPG